MDAYDPSQPAGDLTVPEDAIIETVAETILSAGAPVLVTDSNDQIVGSVSANKIIKVLFGQKQSFEHPPS